MKSVLLMCLLVFSTICWAEKVEVDIKGMTCSMCIEAITKELKNTKKCEKISVNLEKKNASFETIGKLVIKDEEIKLAIKNAGYEAVKISRIK
jgi:copper chaperone CopZ